MEEEIIRYQKAIVEYMLQAMRLETIGFYVEDGKQIYVASNDVKIYAEHFIREAKLEAHYLLGALASNVKVEPENWTE